MAALHSNLLPPYGAMGTKGRYNARHVHFNPRSLHGGRPPSCVLPLSGSHGPIPSMKQALPDKALFRKPASPLPQLKNFGNRIRPVPPLRDGKGCCFQSLQPLSSFLGDGGFRILLEKIPLPSSSPELFSILRFQSGRKFLRLSVTRKIPPVSSGNVEACFILFL